MAGPLITLTTDFGYAGPYIGAMRGVLYTLCPEARVVDITHEIPPHDILAGAFVLAASCRWFPRGTLHVAVVDPGVGTDRRAIVAAGRDQLYIGPDNGLFTLLYDSGEASVVRAIEPARFGIGEVSPTFHGRDVFSPVAARLARGLGFTGIGPTITDPVRLPLRPPLSDGRTLRLQVIHVDRFGNVTTNLRKASYEKLLAEHQATGLDLADRRWAPTPIHSTYAEGPEGRPFLLWGSSGFLEIALDRDRADRLLDLVPGSTVTLHFR